MTRYRGKVHYYIIDNEPDLSYGVGQMGIYPPALAVDFTRIAFKTARSIDPSIRIESPPTNSPESPYLREMLKLGIDRYCDTIGIHAYGAQIIDGRYSKVWEWMEEFNIRKPVAMSEAGVNPAWKPAGMEGEAWRARWLAQFYVASKRYGIAHTLLFDLEGTGEQGWGFIEKQGEHWIPIQPGYNTIRNGFQARGLRAGDFEQPYDLEWDWQVVYNPDHALPPEGVQHLLNKPQLASSGQGCLRLDASSRPLAVRQVVDLLKPGQRHTLHARVRVAAEGRGVIRALGHRSEDAAAAVSAAARPGQRWQDISLVFTPTHSWVGRRTGRGRWRGSLGRCRIELNPRTAGNAPATPKPNYNSSGLHGDSSGGATSSTAGALASGVNGGSCVGAV